MPKLLNIIFVFWLAQLLKIQPNIHLFIFCHTAACGILVLRPGIKPVPPAVEAWSQGIPQPNIFNTIHSKHLPHGAYNVQFLLLDSQKSLFKLKKKSMKKNTTQKCET